MSPFPSPVIRSARLELREYGADDAGLVRGLLAAGAEPETLPPGAPSDPGDVAGWLADGVHRPRREGTGVHLMMLDRPAGRIVGSSDHLPQADTPAEYYFPEAASSSVCGPLALGGVVDVERVDANERGIVVSEPGCDRPGQEVPVLGVGR